MWGLSRRKKVTPRAAAPAPAPAPAPPDDGGDVFVANSVHVEFATPQEAVQALEICRDEEVSRRELGKLALTPSAECNRAQVECANRLMYKLRRMFSDEVFADGFIEDGGADALMNYARAAEGCLEGEAYRTLKAFCQTRGVARCTSVGCLAQLHSVVIRISRTEEHAWAKSVRHAFEALSEIVYRSPAEVADRVHRVFLSSGSHYACIDEVLRRSGTRLLYITATAVCFLLLLCTSATRACAGKMISLWKTAHLPRTLLRLLDEMGDDSTKALIQLLLFTIGCPARVSLLPHHGREVGEFTRFLYRGKGRFTRDPPKRVAGYADPSAPSSSSSQSPDEDLCVEFLDAVKEVAFNALPEEPSSPSSAQDGTLRSMAAAETLTRWRTARVQDETRELIKISCVSNEIALLERELPDALRIEDSNLEAPKQIGRGSFGQVYKAVHALTREEVAVKHLKSVENESDLTGLKRSRAFLREAMVLHRLRNNGIVNFYGWAKSEDDSATGGMWLVTEYCPGGTLAAIVHHRPALVAAERAQVALRVGHSIASALSYIHSTSPRMVHMDVAARNVLVATNGAFKLGDVGSLRYEGERDLQICVPWSPPEALRRGYAAQPAHDVWAFGCLLYEVLEGNTPYHYLREDVTEETSYTDLVREEILDGIIPSPPYSVAEEDPLAQDIWDDIIVRCWASPAAARPQVVDMLLELTSLTNESPRAGGSPLHALQPRRRHHAFSQSPYQLYEGFTSDVSCAPSVSQGLATSRFDELCRHRMEEPGSPAPASSHASLSAPRPTPRGR